MGNPPFERWHADHDQVRLDTFEAAAAFGETVVNTTAGEQSLTARHAGGAANLNGKV
ncbi:hypothetical protein M2164_007654 [Streptomyces sp. SAI-208]|nr:hypothetical protein [Streptomyces sp. SAI-208]